MIRVDLRSFPTTKQPTIFPWVIDLFKTRGNARKTSHFTATLLTWAQPWLRKALGRSLSRPAKRRDPAEKPSGPLWGKASPEMASFLRQLAPRLSACICLLVAAACGLLLLQNFGASNFSSYFEEAPTTSLGNIRDQRHSREDVLWQSMGGFLSGKCRQSTLEGNCPFLSPAR